MIQVRLPKKEVTHIVYDIVHGRFEWEQVMKKYQVVQVDDGEGGGASAGEAANAEGAKTVVVTNARGRFSRPAESLAK